MRRTALMAAVGAGAVDTHSLAAVINVPARETTIQAAIGVAMDGDEIVVAPGTYYRNLAGPWPLRRAGGA